MDLSGLVSTISEQLRQHKRDYCPECLGVPREYRPFLRALANGGFKHVFRVEAGICRRCGECNDVIRREIEH